MNKDQLYQQITQGQAYRDALRRVNESQYYVSKDNDTGKFFLKSVTGWSDDDVETDLGEIPADIVTSKRVDTHDEGGYVKHFLNKEAYASTLAPAPEVPLDQSLKTALDQGVDLRPFYGKTYHDAIQFQQDLGLNRRGKGESLVIPANPVGYKGGFEFDPNFGSSSYRALAESAAKMSGQDPNQVTQKASQYFKDQLFTGDTTKGTIGFTDFGKGMLDHLGQTAGVDPQRLQPLYQANEQLYGQLQKAGAVESQSSGFIKNLAQEWSADLPGILQLGANIATGGLSGAALAAGRGDLKGAATSLALGQLSSAAMNTDWAKDLLSSAKGKFTELFPSFGNAPNNMYSLATPAEGVAIDPTLKGYDYSLGEGFNPSLGLDTGAGGITGIKVPAGFDIAPGIQGLAPGMYATDYGADFKPDFGLNVGTLGKPGALVAGKLLTEQDSQNRRRPSLGGLAALLGGAGLVAGFGNRGAGGIPAVGEYNYNAGVAVQPSAPVYTPFKEANTYEHGIRTQPRRFAEGGIASLGQGRMVRGVGDGMSDSIPASIDGEEPVLIANEEYIIPAQAVSALGNGSSTAGAKVLDGMVKRIFKEQTGKPKQMKPVVLGKVLPR